MTEMPTKICTGCGVEKKLIEYAGRLRRCISCVQAQRQRTMERKDQVAWSPELGERIVDALAAGTTIAEICAQAAMPTARQLRAFRRSNPEFDAACDDALAQSAAAHLDAAKEVLRNVEAGKLQVADGRLLFDGHMRLAATLNPSRYGANATIDLTSAGRPLVDLGAAIKALLDATAKPTALPAPEPIDAEATPAPEGRTLQ
jgi:terminase small subunit-like protein